MAGVLPLGGTVLFARVFSAVMPVIEMGVVEHVRSTLPRNCDSVLQRSGRHAPAVIAICLEEPMLMRNTRAAVHLALVTGVLVGGAAGSTEAQSSRKPTGTLILGEITSIAIRDMNDPASGGGIVVDGRQITLPEKLSIGLPSGQKSLRDLILEAPPECRSQQPPQSGLAVSDSCRRDRPPALARVVASANAAGELVASVVMIQKDSGRTLARIKPERGAKAGSYKRQPSGSTR